MGDRRDDNALARSTLANLFAACYGRGGLQETLFDAACVLGYAVPPLADADKYYPIGTYYRGDLVIKEKGDTSMETEAMPAQTTTPPTLNDLLEDTALQRAIHLVDRILDTRVYLGDLLNHLEGMCLQPGEIQRGMQPIKTYYHGLLEELKSLLKDQ